MHCSKAGQLLQLYIDQQLTLAQMRALELHVATCPACQKDLYFLETLKQSMREIEPVVEPADLTINIMRRVALVPRYRSDPTFSLFRPSLTETITAALLATITTLGIILGQPSLRAVLPFANGHDALSLLFMDLLHSIMAMNSSTLMLALWVVGTVLGVWITLALAGREVRHMEWVKSVMDRLPVR